jgi:hypothetical protein
MEKKTAFEIADPLGSPETLKPRLIYINKLDKSNLHTYHLNLHSISLRVPLFKVIFGEVDVIKLHM